MDGLRTDTMVKRDTYFWVNFCHEKVRGKLAISYYNLQGHSLITIVSDLTVIIILTHSNGGNVKRLWLKSFAHLALDNCDLSANNCKRGNKQTNRQENKIPIIYAICGGKFSAYF